jgi:hypothetical protein
MAAHPRYSYGADHENMGSASLWPLFMIAAVLLGALFAREWNVLAGGLVVPSAVLGRQPARESPPPASRPER